MTGWNCVKTGYDHQYRAVIETDIHEKQHDQLLVAPSVTDKRKASNPNLQIVIY